MTDQEIFDKVLFAIRQQGRAAVETCIPVSGGGPVTLCRYRTTDKTTGAVLKCAAGHLIPDDRYTEDFEGLPARAVWKRGAFPEVTEMQAGWLLSNLQNAHDHSLHNGSLTKWEENMQRIAQNHGLTYQHPPIL